MYDHVLPETTETDKGKLRLIIILTVVTVLFLCWLAGGVYIMILLLIEVFKIAKANGL